MYKCFIYLHNILVQSFALQNIATIITQKYPQTFYTYDKRHFIIDILKPIGTFVICQSLLYFRRVWLVVCCNGRQQLSQMILPL